MDESQLEGLLHFAATDLAANRDGRLSGSQSTRLLWSGVWRLIVGPPLIFGGAAIGFVVDTAAVALLAILAAGAGLYITWRGFAFMIDSLDRDVAFLTAPLKGRTVTTKNGTQYWADVGPVSKRISRSAYESLPRGIVHLYYAPGCRSLLSVEPASADEPRPAHPFGPDSAHAWDRLRWSWVLVTVGVLGIAVGIHQVYTAHPARPIAVEGIVADYVETHGKSTTRTITMADSTTYTPKTEYDYSPPAPAWSSLIGQQVTLYVDAGTSDVIAVNVGGQLYAADWYLNPDHKASFETFNGAITAGASALVVLIGLLLLLRDRRRAESGPGAPELPRSALYAPPTVRPIINMQPGAWIAIGTVLTVAGVFGAVLASQK